jgi:hypothetical protein
MHDESDSSDRRPEEYLLFAIVFLSFTGAAGGVVLSSTGLALLGVAVSLLGLWCFLRR